MLPQHSPPQGCVQGVGPGFPAEGFCEGQLLGERGTAALLCPGPDTTIRIFVALHSDVSVELWRSEMLPGIRIIQMPDELQPCDWPVPGLPACP